MIGHKESMTAIDERHSPHSPRHHSHKSHNIAGLLKICFESFTPIPATFILFELEVSLSRSQAHFLAIYRI